MNRSLLVLAALFATASAQASSTWHGKCASSPNLLINSASAIWFSSYNTSISTATSIAMKNASSLGFYTSADDDSTTSVSNGENELTYTYSFSGTCGVTAGGGCTFAIYDTSTNIRSEIDVFMDGNIAWDTDLKLADTWGYGAAERPAITTLLHEFGHAMGLGHETRYYNMMGSDWTVMTSNGAAYTSALGEDATTGLRALYGSTTGSYEDLAVSHWRYSSFSGEYSTHARNRVQDSAGTELSYTTTAGQPVYTITKGAKGKAEVTVDNNGAAAQTTTLKLYLSADSTITTSDTALLSQSIYMAADVPSTGAYAVTWPSTLTSGATWYVGACVDASSTLTEVREDNNCAYIAQLKVR